MKKLNVGYMRVSTEAQTEKYGLDVQEDKIKELAKKRGVKIARWYVTGDIPGAISKGRTYRNFWKMQKPEKYRQYTSISLTE